MFKAMSILTSVVCVVLFVLFLLVPNIYVETYGVVGDRGADFLGRRASPMFLGLAVMLWLVRNAEPSSTRFAISTGMAILFAGIAFTGLFEFGRGTASGAIVVAAAGELLLAFGFLASRD